MIFLKVLTFQVGNFSRGYDASKHSKLNLQKRNIDSASDGKTSEGETSEESKIVYVWTSFHSFIAFSLVSFFRFIVYSLRKSSIRSSK